MLPRYSSILVTTDLSPNSEHAFRHAVMLARDNNAKIHLLHVVPEIDSSVRSYVSTVMGEGNLEKFAAEHESQVQAAVHSKLEEFAKQELADHPEDMERFAGTIIAHGQAAPQILRVSDQVEADVIVMGTHGKGFLEYTFLGSTAEKVLRKSKRPVFVIPLPSC